MAQILLVVSRTEPRRYTYLKHVFASDVIDVVLDRRVEDRRQRQAPVSLDKRRRDRRQQDVARDLKMYGWAVVRHPSGPGR